MISPSACQPWQPDPRQFNPAQMTLCYTTTRSTFADQGIPPRVRQRHRAYHSEQKPLELRPLAAQLVGGVAERLAGSAAPISPTMSYQSGRDVGPVSPAAQVRNGTRHDCRRRATVGSGGNSTRTMAGPSSQIGGVTLPSSTT